MPRNTALDNLKVLLSMLVVFHHAACAYVVGGSWPIRDTMTTALLIPFQTINSTFFMGLFFFLAGMFVPSSYASLGAKGLLMQKVYTLLVPAIITSLACSSIAYFILQGHPFAWNTDVLPSFLAQSMHSYHAWFLIMLYGFSILWLILKNKIARLPFDIHNFTHILLLAGLSGALTQYVSSYYPINRWIAFGIIEPYHFAQYLLLFLAGTYYGRSTKKLTQRDALRYFGIALALASLYIINFCRDFGLWRVEPYWSGLLGVFLSLGLVSIFENYCQKKYKFLEKCATYSLGIYLIHPMILMPLEAALLNTTISVLLKFLLTGAAAYLLAYIAMFSVERGLACCRRSKRTST